MDIEAQKESFIAKLLQIKGNPTIDFLIEKLTANKSVALSKDCLTERNIDAALFFLSGLTTAFKTNKGVFVIEYNLKDIKEEMGLSSNKECD